MSTLYSYFNDFVGSGTIKTLADGDDLFIKQGVVIGSTDNFTFLSDGSNHTAIIQGILMSDGSSAMHLGSSAGSDHNQKLVVGATGEILGLSSQGVAVIGTSSTVENAGHIYCHDWGLEMYGIGNGSQSSVVNSGLIEGDSYGLTRYGGLSTEKLVVENTGTIKGGSASFYDYGANAVEEITNTGKMIGNVLMGAGNDKFDTSNGVTQGLINMGDGNDTVKGSAAADKIVGGLGADLMTGGKGGDAFIFTKPGDSGIAPAFEDRITDFKHAQKDHLDFSQIDAKTGGADDAFKWIGTQNFHHKEGELHYKVSGGNAYVSGDIDGDGVADFTVRLDHVASLVKGDFFL